MGNEQEGFRFFQQHWPEARGVSDPKLFFYDAFGLGKANLWQFLTPAVWWAFFRALCKGHLVGRPVGSVRVLSGMIEVQGDSILWEQKVRHIADHRGRSDSSH